MSAKIRIVPWIKGSCSLYAVERDGVCLPAEFMQTLSGIDPESAKQLWMFLSYLRSAIYVREAQIRPERPDLGVYALYNHKEPPRTAYNPSRLLCSYVVGTNNILLVGSGFIKLNDEPIQKNQRANHEAMFLGFMARQLNRRIDVGEILTVGSELVPSRSDSFTF